MLVGAGAARALDTQARSSPSGVRGRVPPGCEVSGPSSPGQQRAAWMGLWLSLAWSSLISVILWPSSETCRGVGLTMDRAGSSSNLVDSGRPQAPCTCRSQKLVT